MCENGAKGVGMFLKLFTFSYLCRLGCFGSFEFKIFLLISINIFYSILSVGTISFSLVFFYNFHILFVYCTVEEITFS